MPIVPLPLRPAVLRALPWLAAAALSGLGCSALAAGSGALAVTATVVSKSNCKFTTAGALALNFGAIDPLSTSNVTATTSVNLKCAGSANLATYILIANDGLHASGVGARRMQHASLAAEFLPYDLAVSPSTGSIAKNAQQTITITGTVKPTGFQNAAAGGYSDTVAITLTP